MKQYKELFAQRMQFIAFAVIALIAVFAFATDWQAALGVTSAMALVIGSVTLEGKDEELYKALEGTITSSIEKMNKGYISAEKAAELIGEKIKTLDIKDNEDFKQLKAAIEQHGLAIKSMIETGKSAKGKTVAEQIKEQVEANKEKWQSFKNGELKAFDLVIKVAAEMGTGNANYKGEEIEAGYSVAPRYKNSLMEWLRWGSSSKETFSYIQMINPDGAAVIQADGTIAPLLDFDIAKTTITAADSVARVDISEDMLDDYEGLASLINNELAYKVDLVLEAAIYTTITGASGAYAMTTLSAGAKPNVLDCIRAAVTQIEESGFGMADTVVLRPSDWFNLVSAKDLDLSYVMLPIVTFNGTQVDNLKVIKSTGVTAGYILVFDSTKVSVLNYKGFSAQLGYIANNFAEFVLTIRGKRRTHRFVKSNDAGSFVYDAISTIKTALTEV